jgi:hypothetical protein
MAGEPGGVVLCRARCATRSDPWLAVDLLAGLPRDREKRPWCADRKAPPRVGDKMAGLMVGALVTQGTRYQEFG